MSKRISILIRVFLVFSLIWPLCINKAFSAELSQTDQNRENKIELTQTPKEEKSIDELLGPKDIFPFLPDNHRDSGTGKFAAFE